MSSAAHRHATAIPNTWYHLDLQEMHNTILAIRTMHFILTQNRICVFMRRTMILMP